MSRILVGTTSWTEKTPVESGRFYPPDVHSAEGRLRYYATRFPVVEGDSSYYGLPSARNSRSAPTGIVSPCQTRLLAARSRAEENQRCS